MQDRSELWDERIKNAHQLAIKIEILQSGEVVHTFQDDNSLLTEGQATWDRDDKNRTKGTITITDPTGEFTPADASDLLAPYGTEWRPYAGIRHPEGNVEVLPLGTFGIGSLQIGDTGDGLTMRMEGKDRSQRISRNKLDKPINVPKNGLADQYIMMIVAGAIPELNPEFNMAPEEFDLPSLVFAAGSDPWEACQQLASSCGCEVFFDRTGVLVMQPVPDPLFDPVVWEFRDGETNTMLNLQRDLYAGDNEGPYNHVIIEGEPVEGTAPVRAEVFDTREGSPTKWGGPYGDVTLKVVRKDVKTVAQAQAAAQSEFNLSAGRQETWTFHAVANYALDAGDIIRVHRPLGKVEEKIGMIDVLSFPLVSIRGMEILCRKRPI